MINDSVGKKVEVITPDINYKGILIEIGENDVHLQSDSGWIVIPVEKIIEIRMCFD